MLSRGVVGHLPVGLNFRLEESARVEGLVSLFEEFHHRQQGLVVLRLRLCLFFAVDFFEDLREILLPSFIFLLDLILAVHWTVEAFPSVDRRVSQL